LDRSLESVTHRRLGHAEDGRNVGLPNVPEEIQVNEVRLNNRNSVKDLPYTVDHLKVIVVGVGEDGPEGSDHVIFGDVLYPVHSQVSMLSSNSSRDTGSTSGSN
jgi:hypothetical protein